MRNQYCVLLLFLSGAAGLKAQYNPNGKTYRAEISAACKMFSGGGCMIYRYCELSFDKDSVSISYPVEASCQPAEKEAVYEQAQRHSLNAKWSATGNNVIIEGLGTFAYANGMLSGWNRDEEMSMEFKVKK